MNNTINFTVEEVLRKSFSIECNSIEDGKIQLKDSYDNGEIQLDYDDIWATNIHSKEDLELLTNLTTEYKYLSEPLTAKQVHSKMDTDGYIHGIVAVKDTDLFYNKDYENMLDVLINKFCEISLDNIQYKMLSVVPDDNSIIYEISGDCFYNLKYECSNFAQCPTPDDAEACKNCKLASF